MLEYVDEGKTGDLFRAARQDAEMKAKWQSHVWFFRRISLHADPELFVEKYGDAEKGRIHFLEEYFGAALAEVIRGYVEKLPDFTDDALADRMAAEIEFFPDIL